MTSNKPPPKNIVFFGTSLISVEVFKTLFARGIKPLFLVTTPDAPQGRHLRLAPPPAKEWALKNNIEVLQPDKLKTPPFKETLISRSPKDGYDVFIVASYGKIIPNEIITIPTYGILNVHPSLLPKYRGPSPIPSQILADDKDVGVTIMKMNEKMDEGPIMATQSITLTTWPSTNELKKILGELGGNMIADLLPDLQTATTTAQPQDHANATYTKKFEKSDGEIQLTDDPYKNFLKFQALKELTSVYFFEDPKTKTGRIKITDASYNNGAFTIEKIIPEGKKEMPYHTYLQRHQK